MASIIEILARKFVGAEWRMDNTAADDYRNLTWFAPGERPKEGEIRAFSDEVDGLIVAEAKSRAAEKAILSDKPDATLVAIEILVNSVFDIGAKLRAAALSEALDPNVVQAMQQLRQRIGAERAK